MTKYKIIIVGAGAAGIGNAIALKNLGLSESDFVVLERDQVGASFMNWPEEMKFITPSFTGNQFGTVDLNAISVNTSPAFSIKKEHLSGKEYAKYLKAVANHFELPIKTGIEVVSVDKNKDTFEIATSTETYYTDFVIWCGGEFQFPHLSPFAGAEYCIHNTHIDSYKNIEGNKQVIIGGYESGIDAAINFSQLGKKAIVIDSGTPWENFSSDPSTVLSTYTYERLQNALDSGNIELVGNFKVAEIKKLPKGYEVVNEEGDQYPAPNTPILCTGFSGSTMLIKDLFEYNEDGSIALTEADESTTTKNLFLSGPMVRQNKVIFCFIYKFRQRFPVIAKEIAERLEIDVEGLVTHYKKANMYLDDLSCCDQECNC